QMNWSNRFDLGIQARWNLTDLFTAPERSAIAQAKFNQAHLGYQDLQAKLIMGVQEAHAACNSGRDQIYMVKSAVWHAMETYRLSDLRLTNVKGASVNEVLFAIKSLTGSQFELVKAIREH